MSQQRVTPLPRTAMSSSVPPHTTPTTHTTIQPSTTSPPTIPSRRGPTVSAIVSYGAAAAACRTIQVLEEIPDHSSTRQHEKAVSNTGGGLSSDDGAMPFTATTPVEYAAALVEQLSLNGVASRLPHRGLPSPILSPLTTVTNSSTVCSSKMSWFTHASPTTILPTPLSRSQLSDRTSSSTTTSILTSPNGRGLASVFDNIGGSAASSSPLSSSATTTRASPSSSIPTTLLLYIPVIDASALQAEESLMPELLTYLRRASGNAGNSVEEMMIIPVLLVDTFSPSFSDLYSKEALEVIAALRENCFVVDAVLPRSSSQTSSSSSSREVELLRPDDVALKITYLLEELRQVGEEAAYGTTGNKGGNQVKFDVPASNRQHPAASGQTPLAWSVSSQAGGARGGADGSVIEPPSVWSSSNADDAYNLLSFDNLEENGLLGDDDGKSTNSQKHKISNTNNNMGDFVSTDVSVHDVLVRDLRGFISARSLAAATRSQQEGIQSSSGSTPSASPLLAASGSTRTLSPPLSPDGGGSSVGSGSTTTMPSSNVKVNTGLVRRLEEALTVAAASWIRIGEVGGHHRVAGGHVAAQAQGRSCLYEKPTAVSSGTNIGASTSRHNHLSSSSLYALVPKTSANQNPIGRGEASSSGKASDDLQNADDGRFPYAFSPLSLARRMTLLHVTQLDLSNLFLGDLGVSSLCVTFFPYLVPRLRALNLDGNGISEKGIKWLIGKKRTHSVPETSQFSEKVSGGGIAGHPSLETVLLRDNRLNQPAIVMLCGFVSALNGTAGASLTTINVEANPFNFSTHWCGQLESLLAKRKEKLDKVVSEENIQSQQSPLINNRVMPPPYHDYSTAAAPPSAHRLTMSWTVSRELGGKWYGRVTISTRGVPPSDGGRYFTEVVTFGPMPIITCPTSTSPHRHHHGHARLVDTFSDCLQMIRAYFNIPNTTLVEEEVGAVEPHHHNHHHQSEKATTSFVDTQCLTIRRGGGGGGCFRLVLSGKEGDGLEDLTQSTLSSLIAACSVAKKNTQQQHHQQPVPAAAVDIMKGVKHRLLYELLKGARKSSSAEFDVAAKLVFEPPVVVSECTNTNKMSKAEEEDVLASSVSTPFTPRSPFFLQATFRLATTSKTVSSTTRDGDGVSDGQHHHGSGSDISVVSLRRSAVQYMTSQVLSFVGCLHEEILLACSQL